MAASAPVWGAGFGVGFAEGLVGFGAYLQCGAIVVVMLRAY